MLSKKSKIIIFFLLLSIWVILEGATKAPTLLRLTNFSRIAQLYQPIKDNKDIKIIAAYPTTLAVETASFLPNYQLVGQIVHNKTLVGGVDPFTPNGMEFYYKTSDISNPDTIANLTQLGVDTIMVYNNFVKNPQKVISQLMQDKRLIYLGNYTVPYDENSYFYVSNSDLSRNISLFQIKDVVSKKIDRQDVYADGGKMQFRYENDHKILLTLSGISNGNKIYFRQTYSPNWRLYPKDSSFDPFELAYLWKKPALDNTHQMINDYGNSWAIDTGFIKKNFDKSYYKENQDGSMDMELVLYYKAQVYDNLGWLVSGTTIFGCLVYLFWDWRRGHKIKKLNENETKN